MADVGPDCAVTSLHGYRQTVSRRACLPPNTTMRYSGVSQRHTLTGGCATWHNALWENDIRVAVADSRRWIARSNVRLPGEVDAPRMNRAPPTSGPATRHGLLAAKVARRVTITNPRNKRNVLHAQNARVELNDATWPGSPPAGNWGHCRASSALPGELVAGCLRSASGCRPVPRVSTTHQ